MKNSRKELEKLPIEEIRKRANEKITKGKRKGCATKEALAAQRMLWELSGQPFSGNPTVYGYYQSAKQYDEYYGG